MFRFVFYTIYKLKSSIFGPSEQPIRRSFDSFFNPSGGEISSVFCSQKTRPLSYISPLQRWRHAALPVSAVCESLSVSVQAVKHDALTQSWANVGPPSTTLSQH